jgi:hypothetical protein
VPTTLKNTIQIDCRPEVLYGYLTQPWRWHEWHPNSISASAAAEALEAGDEFEEVIEIRPLSPLPVRLRRRTIYQVRVAEPFATWEVHGETRDGWLGIRYELQPCAGGTLFTRTLTYQTTGLSTLLMPLLERRMADTSRVALGNLKARVESMDADDRAHG